VAFRPQTIWSLHLTRALVLLAAYNGAEWIEEQVESILSQRGVTVRLVIGDDASQDATRSIIADRFGHDERVAVLSWQTPSGSAGANFMRLMSEVDASEFDVIALSDQDDVWFPDKLSSGVAALGTTGAAGYSSAVLARWPDGRENVLSQCARTRRSDFLFEGAGQGCTFVIERAFFQRVQHLVREAKPGMHFHDWLLYLLSRAWGYRWAFDATPTMIYRQHAGNDIGARGGSSAFARRMEKIRNGWYADQIGMAGRLYKAAGGSDPAVLGMIDGLEARPTRGFFQTVRLAVLVLRDGRRRLVDRLVLCLAVCAGWI